MCWYRALRTGGHFARGSPFDGVPRPRYCRDPTPEEWREGGRGGKVRARQLGAITEKGAQFELAAMQAGKRTRAAKQTVTAKRAVDEYLRHLKASGRRDGTILHDRDKLNPLLHAWSDTPLSNWSRTMLEGFLNDREWAPYRARNALGVYRRFVAWCDAVGYGNGVGSG